MKLSQRTKLPKPANELGIKLVMAKEKNNDIQNLSIEYLQNFLNNQVLKNIIKEYAEALKHSASAGFNVFTMISDFYYRETFHSDALAAFLDPKGLHGEKDKFLKIFLQMLNIDKAKIDNYGEDSIVEKEVGLEDNNGRIDILIRNNGNNSCIIIENKLNDAPDMERQLPRYYNYFFKKEYSVDAIVYLPLNPYKTPDRDSWDSEDIQKVNSVLNVIPANGEISLVNNWIKPCKTEASNNINKSILYQYQKLLTSLYPMIEQNNSLSDFCEFLINEKKLNQAILLKRMVDSIPTMMAKRLHSMLEKVVTNYNVNLSEWDSNSVVIVLNGENRIYAYFEQDGNNAEYRVRLGVRDFSAERYDPKWVQNDLPDELKNWKKIDGKLYNDEYYKIYDEEVLSKTVSLIENLLQIYAKNK